MTILYRNSTADINAPDGSACGACKRTDLVHCLVIVLVTFLVYAWSAPGTVGLEDDGYFILAAYFNGIAHPPGYPLYTLLAHAATLIPLGSVALRVHLLSGVLGALACACMWCVTCILVRDRTAAYAAALSLAFSKVFWSQAIIAKGIYTLNVFLLLAAFLCVLALRTKGPGQEAAWAVKLLFLCYGLALSNHWPLVILTTPMFIVALWQDRKKFLQYLVQGLPFLLLGLTPYIWMAIRSQMNPEIIFFGPVENIADFWHYISRQPYAEIDYSPSAGWIDKLQYMKYVLTQTGEQFSPFGWLLVLAGLVWQRQILSADLCVALILGYLGSTVFLILLLGFDFDGYHEIIFGVYPLFSYAIAAFWLGIGLTSIVNVPVKMLALQSPGRFIPIVLAVLIVGATLSANAVWNFRQNDYWARWYAVTVLDSLPHDAILFTDGLAEGAIAYLNKIEGYRNDVTLYSVRGALFNNRLFNQLKDDNVQSINAINEFIKTETRPVYYISNLLHDHGIEYNGLYYKVLKSQETNFVHIVIMPRVLAYLKYILAIEPHDPWEKIHRTVILGNGCYLLTAYAENPGQNMQDIGYLKNLRNKLCDNLAGSYVIINKIMDSPLPDWNMVRLLLEKAEKQSNEAMLKSSISNLDYYRGVMYLRTGDNDKGRYFLEQSLAKWNHPENKAKSELAKIKK